MLTKLKRIYVNEKAMYWTMDTTVFANQQDQNIENVTPCSREEGDTHILLYAFDAAKLLKATKGASRIMLRIVHTDILVLVMSYFTSCQT